MWNLIKLLFGIVIFISVISMFQISWEIGLSVFVLITATFCIWIVLKKITKVVFYPDFVLSSEPFRDSVTSGGNEEILGDQDTSASGNLIPGVDESIFEQFREKLNLHPPSESTGDSAISSEKNANSGLVAEAYEKANSTNAPDTFSEELEDVEQVKVTLSKDAKNLQEEQDEGNAKDTVEEQSDDAAEEQNKKVAEKQETKYREKEKTDRKLGTGEEALEILSRKHQEIRRQTRDIAAEPQEEFDEDLFADELIPIPGGETLAEPEEREFSDEDLFAPAPATDNLEDEDGLVSSLRETTLRGEKNAEAEGLLKLATTSCEAGRMEEAGASLKSYLDLLKELGQKPSSDVLHLAEKLGIPLDSTLTAELALKTDETKTETEKEPGKNIQDEPEQTNYESVMDGIVKTLEEKDSYEEALPLLKDLLNYNRQRVNISAMDPLYERIERAHSTMENDEELVATYKEHLAIKQQLDDIEGELHLLDLISAHYTNIGDLKASKRYQSEILRVKDGLEYKQAMEEEVQ